MPGTREGAAKAQKTLKERYPNFYQDIGRKGGSKLGVKKGFALDTERAREAGRKGGMNGRGSKKGPRKKVEVVNG